MTDIRRADGQAITPARRIRLARTFTALATGLALVVAGPMIAPAVADDDPAPVSVVAPADAAITGGLVVDGTAHLELGEWTPADAHVTVTWWQAPQAYVVPVGDEDANPGATVIPDVDGVDLTLGADLEGRYLWAVAVGTADGMASASVIAATDEPVGLAQFGTLPTVAITGAANVGSALTASLTGSAPQGSTTSYQWRRDGGEIADATTAQYLLTAADLDHTIDVVVGFAKTGYAPASVTATAVTIGVGTLTPVATPTLSGAVRVDGIVTVRPGTWAAGTTFTYRWRVTDAKNKTSYVTGAVAPTYKPTTAQRGLRLSVVVTGSLAGYAGVTKTSGLYTIGAGAFTKAPAPVITGSAYVGAKLTAVRGTWSPAATYSYQWKRNGAKISGAAKSTYTVTSKDLGKRITVTVTAKRTAYTTVAKTSAATAKVTKPFSKTYAPTVSGTARAGSTLKATVKTWSPKATFSYQWKRNGVAIKGATRSSYTLTTTDPGYTITVTVTGKRSGYFTTARTSKATAKIGAPITMSRDGMFQVGKQIAPGTYVATGGPDCWFERRSDALDTAAGVLGFSFNWQYSFGGQKVVTIASTDKYFYTEGCGRWSLAATNLKVRVSDGTWIVGRDVKPGVWRLVGPIGANGCYIEFTRSFTGVEALDVTDSYAPALEDYIRIEPGDKGFTTAGCGGWFRIAD